MAFVVGAAHDPFLEEDGHVESVCDPLSFIGCFDVLSSDAH